MLEIRQRQLARTPAESLDLNFQPAPPLRQNPPDPPDYVVAFIPGFDRHDFAPSGERKVSSLKGDRIDTRFQQNRLAAGLKKSLYGLVRGRALRHKNTVAARRKKYQARVTSSSHSRAWRGPWGRRKRCRSDRD